MFSPFTVLDDTIESSFRGVDFASFRRISMIMGFLKWRHENKFTIVAIEGRGEDIIRIAHNDQYAEAKAVKRPRNLPCDIPTDENCPSLISANDIISKCWPGCFGSSSTFNDRGHETPYSWTMIEIVTSPICYIFEFECTVVPWRKLPFLARVIRCKSRARLCMSRCCLSPCVSSC